MTCRAPSSSQTCSGTPTGQLLTYDNEGRTTAWQNAQSNPTSTEQMAYDGEGNRVALVVTGGMPTYYLGSLEEISGSTLTKYFTAGNGLPTAMRVGTGGPISYLASDGLGSVSEALDGSGNVTSQQLFTPYGSSRYGSGTSPTTFAFTGQRADGASGLDDYNARYYDPTGRQFASADTASDGLNRYGYVHGNPETLTDPSGQRAVGCNYGDGDWYCPPPPPPPTTTPPTGCTTNCGGGGNPPGGTPPVGCQATHDCDGTASGTPVLATTDDIQACYSFGYPAWCEKYLTYGSVCQAANGHSIPCYLTSYWDPIKIQHQVDFVVLQVAVAPDFVGVGQLLFSYIYLTPTHSLSDVDWLDPDWKSVGLSLGVGISLLGGNSALLGFGVLLTKGALGATAV